MNNYLISITADQMENILRDQLLQIVLDESLDTFPELHKYKLAALVLLEYLMVPSEYENFLRDMNDIN